MSNQDIRTRMLLDIMFPPVSDAPRGLCPMDGYSTHETTDEEAGVKVLHFTYSNRQGAKPKAWHVNLYDAVYFMFRCTPYMVIRGDYGGPVCFNLNHAIVDDCSKADFISWSPEYHEVLDFPTEDTQDWLLKQQGF
jgi:hypothetical protein